MVIRTLICLTALFCSTNALAAQKQEMKCYVKDATGVDGIYLINSLQARIPYLKTDLVGKKFTKGLAKNRRIEQVVECVKETDEFDNVIARQLDRQTLR
ncbi:TapY2 family type IVa secretion system protein [Thalassotalea sp. LPB0316]|uniref:TapY2 family type IVa secretion system protein n=1 Tax=Thalassotalea sp. LPB0316 TaxID=2769490 RepID=UPI001865F793|nr:TapY2 family type IVa secretion system protein [Thalassotalea sp. LPB0316]QOL25770.1 TapY2 family type IVa secretion system protein [Thalassotalea sp. LPB0316]